MPLVHIDLLEGRPPDYHAAILEAVRAALVESANVVHERIVQRIHEVGPEALDVPPAKTERAIVIEVTMMDGRSPELKAAFFADVRQRLAEDPGIAPEDVYVTIGDKPHGD